MGHKNEKDLSICLGTFKNVTTLDFIAMYSKGEVIITPEKKEEKPKDIPSQEEVRLKRLAFFDKK